MKVLLIFDKIVRILIRNSELCIRIQGGQLVTDPEHFFVCTGGQQSRLRES
jgi:hypothetical protein